jgi:questin oxidase-like protein
MKDYSLMEPALEFLAPYGPDLRNGLTNHAPMAVEALAALNRADAVMPWLENYRKGMLPRPVAHERIERENWRTVLGNTERVADWNVFFENELKEAPWREVLARWTARLAPGFCASAMHGIIRVGHAARSLGESETSARIRELADGLGYWAAAYQTLPTARHTATPTRAQEAIARVPFVPLSRRKFSGTIVSSLAALDEFSDFAPVVGLLDVTRDPGRVISDVSETFTRVYLANARDVLSTIVFIHGVTGVVALRSLLPYLSDATVRDVLRYAWQGSCALYSAFGQSPAKAGEVEPPRESRNTLIDMAVANGDEHVIKFTEACLREYDLNPSPAYLAAARHSITVLTAS